MATGTSVKVAIVGAGSIGLRHQKILGGLNHEVVLISRHDPSAKYKSLDGALVNENFDYVVIASETSRHTNDLNSLINNGFAGQVLVEKPLFAKSGRLQENIFAMAAVGYNLRFHPAILWLKQTLPSLGAITSANLYVGQYLPNWRPSTDYRQSSSARNVSGGGVLRDLSHELDLVQNIFGNWQKLTALGGKFSNLEIDTEDTFLILMKAELCSAVSIQMNYLDRINQRSITVNGNNGSINIDLISGLASFNDLKMKFEIKPDDTYLAQHQAMLAGNSENTCSLYEGSKIVEMIEAIEKSARKQRWISR